MKEIWKDVRGYGGLYQISNLGKVKALGKKRRMPYGGYHMYRDTIMAGALDGSGYRFVGLSKKGIKKLPKIHRLVGFAFIPNPYKKPCINHKDNNRSNNIVINLEWCTYKENMQHASRQGRMSSHTPTNAILNPKKVKEIRQLRGTLLPSEIGLRFGVAAHTIRDIFNGKTWIKV